MADNRPTSKSPPAPSRTSQHRITLKSALLIVPLASLLPFIVRTFYSSSSSSSSRGTMTTPTTTFSINQLPTLSASKTIVITGANSGLGYSTTKLLVHAGTARMVIMGCRNVTKCDVARESIQRSMREKEEEESEEDEAVVGRRRQTGGGGGVELIALPLDLSSLQSVQNFASEVQRILPPDETAAAATTSPSSPPPPPPPPPLDVLINNAGIMGHSATSTEISPDTNAEVHMAVNHMGHFALTSLLLPNLRQSQGHTTVKLTDTTTLTRKGGGGRVVTVSSLIAALPFHLHLNDLTQSQWGGIFRIGFVRGFRSYGISKRANLLFAHGLHTEYSSSITSVSAHPGYSRTSLMLTGWNFLPKWMGTFLHYNIIGSMSSDIGASSQLRAAFDPLVQGGEYVGPKLGIVGEPIVVGTSLRSWHHWGFNVNSVKEEVEELWKVSEKSIGWEFDSIHRRVVDGDKVVLVGGVKMSQ